MLNEGLHHFGLELWCCLDCVSTCSPNDESMIRRGRRDSQVACHMSVPTGPGLIELTVALFASSLDH